MVFNIELTPEQRRERIPVLVQSIKNSRDVNYSEAQLRKLLALEGKTFADVDLTEEEINEARKENCLSDIDELRSNSDPYKFEGLKKNITRTINEFGISETELGLQPGELQELINSYYRRKAESYLIPLRENFNLYDWNELRYYKMALWKFDVTWSGIGLSDEEFKEFEQKAHVLNLRNDFIEFRRSGVPNFGGQSVAYARGLIAEGKTTYEELGVTKEELDEFSARAPKGIR